MPDKQIIYFIVFSTLIILLLIGAVVVSVFLSHRRRVRQELAFTQANLAYESELRTIESEVQEATLTHIASELHDNIGQLLSLMKLQIEKQKLLQPEITSTLAPVSSTLQKTLDEVRLLSHSLSNDFINDVGLQQVITQEVQRLNAVGIFTVHFETDNIEPSLPKDMRTVAFRIFQEATNNVVKHAKAKNIFIILQGQNFSLQLRDDGAGFDKDVILENSRGLGLKNMLRRAALIGLKCSIDAAPGKGCLLTVSCNSTTLKQPTH